MNNKNNKSIKVAKGDKTAVIKKIAKSDTVAKSGKTAVIKKVAKSDTVAKSGKIVVSKKITKSDIVAKSGKTAVIKKIAKSDTVAKSDKTAVIKKVAKSDTVAKSDKTADNAKMKIFIVAGEFSGDIHASNLVKELRLKFPNMELYGTGGDKLMAEGQEQYYHVREMSVIGFVSVLKYLGKILSMLRDLKKKIKEVNPDLLIFVDYPGFNLRLAKMAAALKIPTVYFISPQFWVWGKNRIYKLRDYTDKVITIFPFEEGVLREAGVDAVYVGNPVVDNIEYLYDSKESFLEDCNLTSDKPIVAIFPGSRFLEVSESIPLFLSAAKKLRDKYQFVISRSEYFKKDQFEKLMGTYKISVMKGSQYDMMKYCDIAWACSGSITLEISLFKKPMVITYNSHKLNIMIGKLLSKLRMIGLPNIIIGEKFLPELIGKDFKVDKLLKATKYIEENRESIVDKLSQVSSLFIGKTPSKSAAEEIFSLYENIKSKK